MAEPKAKLVLESINFQSRLNNMGFWFELPYNIVTLNEWWRCGNSTNNFYTETSFCTEYKYTYILARPIFDQLLSWVLSKKPVVQIGLGSPKTKFQSYRPINDTSPSIFVFGSIIVGKEPLAELKFANCMNQESASPFWGVFCIFFSPFLDLGHFLALENGHFWFMRFHFRTSIKTIFKNCKF